MKVHRIVMNVIIASLMGIAVCLIIKALTAVSDLQSNTVFIAELDKNIFPGQRITAETLIGDLQMVRKESLRLIPSSEALAMMKMDMPELQYMADNPFNDVITFKTSGVNQANIVAFISSIKDIAGVSDVIYDKELVSTLAHSSRRARIGLLLISSGILIGAFIALILRIRRDLRPFKRDMKILSMAGSTDDDIVSYRRQWSAKWGTVSAVLSAFIVLINIIFINRTLLVGLEITLLQAVISVVIMMILVIAAHIGYTHYSIKSYLAQLNASIKS